MGRIPYIPSGAPLTNEELVRAINERLGRVDGAIARISAPTGAVDRAPVTGTTPPVVEAPGLPTGVTITYESKGDNYLLTTAWTTPAPVGGAILYEVQIRFYNDDAGADPDSDWIGMPTVLGSAAVESVNGPFTKRGIVQWVKARVRGINIEEEVSAWSDESALASIGAASGTTPERPIQPAPEDYSVTIIAQNIPDQYGRQMAQVRVEILDWPAGADFFSVWTYEGTDPPTDPAFWLLGDWGSQEKFDTGNTTKDVWPAQPPSGTTYQICVTFSTRTYFTAPDADTVAKEFVLSAIGAPLAATNFNVTAEFNTDQSQDPGALKMGRFIVSGTAPTDTRRHEFRVDRRWFTDGTFTTPLVSWTPVFYFRTFPHEQPKWSWGVGSATAWYEWRIVSVGWDAQETVGSPIVQMTLTADGTVDLGYVKGSSIGTGVAVVAGQLQIAVDSIDNLVMNGNWKFGSVDFLISSATYFWTVSGGGESSSNAGEIKPGGYVEVSANPIFCQTGEVFVVSVRYKAIGTITLGAGSGGHTNHLCIEWVSGNGSVVSHSNTSIGTSTSWVTITATVTAPAGAVYLKIYAYRGHLTAGYMRIGRVVCYRQRSLADIVDRAITDAKIALGGIADHNVLADNVIGRNAMFAGSVVTNRVLAADVNAEKVTAGSFSGRALTVTLNGVRVDVDVIYDAAVGDYAGIRLTFPANSGRMLLNPGVMWGFDVNGNLTTLLSMGGAQFLYRATGGGTFQLLPLTRNINLSGGEWLILNNGSQILRGRQAAVSATPLQVVGNVDMDWTFNNYQIFFNMKNQLNALIALVGELKARLGTSGHGLFS